MSKRIVAVLVGLLLAGTFFIGCSSKEESAKQETTTQESPKQGPPVLKEFGPTDIKAGQVFNKQPNGEAAIWAKTENVTPSTVLVINAVDLTSNAPRPDGRSITAQVPKSLYEKAGEYPLYLLDKKTGLKSNELKFIVKP